MAYQGNLDGLCGPYAVTNALAAFGEDEDQIFRACLRALKSKAPDSLVCDGTTIDDILRMKSMINSCAKKKYKFLAPFKKNPPATQDSWWKKFEQECSEDRMKHSMIILGLNKPSAHWIVCDRQNRRTVFIDSTPNASPVRKNRRSLYIGTRPMNDRQWAIDRNSLIVIECHGR